MRDFNDTGTLAGSIDFHLAHTVGKTLDAASITDWRLALSRAVRDKLIDPWFEATRRTYSQDNKRVYYLSMEFLLGRILQDAVNNLGLEDEARTARDAGDRYVLLPAKPQWPMRDWTPDTEPLPDGFEYSSETNTLWMPLAELRDLIDDD